jgi:thioredoxin 1
MKLDRILNIAIIIILVILVSYLIVNKCVKREELAPAMLIVQKIAEPPVTETKNNEPGIKVTFIELGSVGCTPCDMMRPILDEIEKEYEGQVNVRFYDVKSLFGGPYAEKYRVQFIPTQVFLDKDGIEYYRHVGFFPKDEVVKILELRGVK